MLGSRLVLISCQLLDEGAVEGLPSDPRLIYRQVFTSSMGCSYRELQTTIITGRRFGTNVKRRWTQARLIFST